MPRQLASINLLFALDGSLTTAHIQERLVVEDGEGGHLSRDLPLRAINPGDTAALERVFGELAGQQQVVIATLEAKVTDLDAKAARVDALEAEVTKLTEPTPEA